MCTELGITLIMCPKFKWCIMLNCFSLFQIIPRSNFDVKLNGWELFTILCSPLLYFIEYKRKKVHGGQEKKPQNFVVQQFMFNLYYVISITSHCWWVFLILLIMLSAWCHVAGVCGYCTPLCLYTNCSKSDLKLLPFSFQWRREWR